MSRRFRQRPLKEVSEELHSENVSYEKGGSLAHKAQVKDLERLIVRMRENAELRTEDITGPLREDFNKLRNLVALLYNTEAYQILWDLVVKHFAGTRVAPGTLGAYCGGCLALSEDGSCNACSATCAGAIPPKLPDWSMCENSVIVGVPNGSNHSFSLTHQANVDKHHYVFIYKSGLQTTNIELNPDQIFSANDVKRLSGLGATKVHVYAYDEGNKYYDLTKGPKELKVPEERRWMGRWHGSKNQGTYAIGFLVFLIIIIFVLVVLYRRRR